MRIAIAVLLLAGCACPRYKPCVPKADLECHFDSAAVIWCWNDCEQRWVPR